MNWQETLAEPLKRVLARVLEYLPNVLGAIALVLIGWLTARILRATCRRFTEYGLDRLGQAKSFRLSLRQQAMLQILPAVVGGFVFWIVQLVFVVAGIEALGLPEVSDLFSRIISYLPQVLLATFIVFAGILLGEFSRNWIVKSAVRAGLVSADSIGRSVEILVIVVAFVIAVDHLQIDSTFLVVVLAIVAGSTFGAIALAFGLGTSPIVRNIVAAHYVQKAYRVGSRIKIGELQGELLEISTIAVILGTPEGKVQVPSCRFIEEVSVLVDEGEPSGPE